MTVTETKKTELAEAYSWDKRQEKLKSLEDTPSKYLATLMRWKTMGAIQDGEVYFHLGALTAILIKREEGVS